MPPVPGMRFPDSAVSFRRVGRHYAACRYCRLLIGTGSIFNNALTKCASVRLYTVLPASGKPRKPGRLNRNNNTTPEKEVVWLAFGRDGSELELNIMDLQNRTLERALKQIIKVSKDRETVKIARAALDEAEDIMRRLGD